METTPTTTLEQQVKAAIVAFLLDDGRRPRSVDTLDLLKAPEEVERLFQLAAGCLRSRLGHYCD